MSAGSVEAEARSELLSFPVSEARELLPRALTWVAMVAIYLVAHTTPRTLNVISFELLELVTGEATVQAARQVTFDTLVPLEAVVFFLALVVLALPMGRAVWRARSIWRSVGVVRTLVWAGVLYALLCLFAWPDPTVLDTESGLFLMGRYFGDMTLDPFANDFVGTRVRLLKPAIAYLLHLRGHFPYYVFSLIGVFAFVWVAVVFLEWKSASFRPLARLGARARFITWLSLFTSCFVLGNFQWPGYVDHITFTLILLAAMVPMTTSERLGVLVLCMVNHDASLFGLAPLVLFCFPARERLQGFVVLGLYFLTNLATYGFSVPAFLEYSTHGSGSLKGPVWTYAWRYPERVIGGWFFVYKLFWGFWLYGLWRLRRAGRVRSVVALAALTLAPLPLTFIAWDTSRLVSFGFLGMVLVVSWLVGTAGELPSSHRRALAALVLLNLLVPTYNYMLLFPFNAIYSLTPGFYRWVHELVVAPVLG